MKTFETITLLFAIAAGISAHPAENGPSVDIVTDGEFTYTGQATVRDDRTVCAQYLKINFR